MRAKLLLAIVPFLLLNCGSGVDETKSFVGTWIGIDSSDTISVKHNVESGYQYSIKAVGENGESFYPCYAVKDTLYASPTPDYYWIVGYFISDDTLKHGNESYTKVSNSEKAESVRFEPNFPPPIDLRKLKRLPFLGITLGVMTESETKKFNQPTSNGFYGNYQLINRISKDSDLIGYIVVYAADTAENWKFDNDNETFVEIGLQSNAISAWDSISVGMTEQDVLKFVGKNFHYKKGTLLCCEFGDYSANFTNLSDTVCRLIVGKYAKARGRNFQF